MNITRTSDKIVTKRVRRLLVDGVIIEVTNEMVETLQDLIDADGCMEYVKFGYDTETPTKLVKLGILKGDPEKGGRWACRTKEQTEKAQRLLDAMNEVM